MNTFADKTRNNEKAPAAMSGSRGLSQNTAKEFEDNRPETEVQQQFKKNASPAPVQASRSNENSPLQLYLKIGPRMVTPEEIDFVVERIIEEALKIESIYAGSEKKEKEDYQNPTLLAYRKGITSLLLDNRKMIREIVTEWVEASPGGLISPAKESLKEAFTQQRGGKARWKEFGNFLDLTLAVGYEMHPETIENLEFEKKLGMQIAQNPAINDRLNSVRLKLMLWIKQKYEEDKSWFVNFKSKFKIGGSYNLGHLKGVTRDFDTILETEHLEFTDNIEIIHDLMELTSDKGAGSLLQGLGGKKLAPPVKKDVYDQLAITPEGELFESRPMRPKTDQGSGGASWKAARHYDLKLFDLEFQEFQEKKKQESPFEFELKELSELNEKEEDVKPKEKELKERYTEKREEKMSKATNYERKKPVTLIEKMRDSFLIAMEWKSKPNTSEKPTLNTRSKGRHNVGTRDEFDPVTITARRHNVPIEAGRSMTTARMLELCNQVLQESDELEMQTKGMSELDAVAQSIFAYWASVYNQALTPIHTYHEVMDVARKYGVDYLPFHYKILNDDMTTNDYRPMDRGMKLGKKKDLVLEELRERPYRPTEAQVLRLAERGQEVRWITPDGDCFFNAARASGLPIGATNTVREQLANFLLLNRLNYVGYIHGGLSVEEVAAQIKKPGSFFNLGGDLTPRLLSDFTGKGITIINEDGSVTDINGGSGMFVVLRVTNPLPHFHTYRDKSKGESDTGEVEMTDFTPFKEK